jgi:hypothetical protein
MSDVCFGIDVTSSAHYARSQTRRMGIRPPSQSTWAQLGCRTGALSRNMRFVLRCLRLRCAARPEGGESPGEVGYTSPCRCKQKSLGSTIGASRMSMGIAFFKPMSSWCACNTLAQFRAPTSYSTGFQHGVEHHHTHRVDVPHLHTCHHATQANALDVHHHRHAHCPLCSQYPALPWSQS